MILAQPHKMITAFGENVLKYEFAEGLCFSGSSRFFRVLKGVKEKWRMRVHSLRQYRIIRQEQILRKFGF